MVYTLDHTSLNFVGSIGERLWALRISASPESGLSVLPNIDMFWKQAEDALET